MVSCQDGSAIVDLAMDGRERDLLTKTSQSR